jgi:hypothetical protein
MVESNLISGEICAGRWMFWSVVAEWLGCRTRNQRVVGSNSGEGTAWYLWAGYLTSTARGSHNKQNCLRHPLDKFAPFHPWWGSDLPLITNPPGDQKAISGNDLWWEMNVLRYYLWQKDKIAFAPFHDGGSVLSQDSTLKAESNLQSGLWECRCSGKIKHLSTLRFQVQFTVGPVPHLIEKATLFNWIFTEDWGTSISLW